MIVRLTDPSKKRETRLKFMKDDVFLIANEALKSQLGTLSIFELFASAEAFADYLVKNEVTDESFMGYEVEDVLGELDGDQDEFLLLSLTFVKLCAMRNSYAPAADVARSLVGFCQKYDGFTDLLIAMDNKEHKMRLDEWRADLANYELKTIVEDELGNVKAKIVIKQLVDNCEKMSADAIEKILVPLMCTNKQYGGAFDEDVNRLLEKLRIKTTTQFHIDKINDIHDNTTVEIGGAKAHG